MKRNQTRPARPELESVRHNKTTDIYILKLYIAGQSLNSSNAVANVKKICEENLQGRHELEVIDLYQQPQLAQKDQIIAVPTLIKKYPHPLRRIIGDMSDSEHLPARLDI